MTAQLCDLGPHLLSRYVKHQYSKMLTYMTTMKTDAILDAFGVKSFNTPALFNSIFPGITRFTPDVINTGMVRMLMNAIVGFQEDNFDAEVLRDWLTFMPGGTSVRNILHWSQASRHGNFTAYDYGKEDKNMKAYGTKMPPEVRTSDLKLRSHFSSHPPSSTTRRRSLSPSWCLPAAPTSSCTPMTCTG